MKAHRIACLAAAAMFTSATSIADEVTVVSNVLGPEGPLYVDGSLYYVAWIGNTLSKWNGKTVTVLNDAPAAATTGWRSPGSTHF
jgi:hypothetical protein